MLRSTVRKLVLGGAVMLGYFDLVSILDATIGLGSSLRSYSSIAIITCGFKIVAIIYMLCTNLGQGVTPLDTE